MAGTTKSATVFSARGRVLGLFVVAVAFSPLGAAWSGGALAAGPGTAQSTGRFSFTPIKARFAGTSSSVTRGFTKSASGLRISGVPSRGIAKPRFTLPKASQRPVRVGAVQLTGQTNTRTSNFAKSRNSIKLRKPPVFVKGRAMGPK